MPEPVMIVGALAAYFATHYMDNVVAAEINGLGHHIARTTLRAMEGDPGERANHDIARTVRLAQLAGLEAVLDGYARLRGGSWARDGDAAAAFLHEAAAFCRNQRRVARTTPACLSLEVLESLQAAVDGLLAPGVMGSVAHTYAATLAGFAEDAVLAELDRQVPPRMPGDFASYFRNGAAEGHPRFLDGFGDEMREAVKSNPRYRDILLVTGVSEIKAQGFEITETLLGLERRFGLEGAALLAVVERIDGRTEAMQKGMQEARQRTDAMLATVISQLEQLIDAGMQARTMAFTEPSKVETVQGSAPRRLRKRVALPGSKSANPGSGKE